MRANRPEGQDVLGAIPETYRVAVKACQDADKVIGRSEANSFRAFITDTLTYKFASFETAKTTYKTLEKEYQREFKLSPNALGAYRSAKSTVLRAIKYGVNLIDSKGTPLGKSMIESEIKRLKGERTPLDGFKVHMIQATKLIGDFSTEDEFLTALNLVKDLSETGTRAWQVKTAKPVVKKPNGSADKTVPAPAHA